ncbi:uncharacterized protein [Cherax quadricarinatus]|uniref:uncharacterized protein n=1 Tax=Cherax quadricarinatus TaxID=27406 RepID=UPI00387EBBA9
MAPKRAATAIDEPTPKRSKKVMNLEDKVKLLDKCKAGYLSNSAIGKLFDVNESTVRSIKKNEVKIRAALASTAPPSAKQVSQVRNSAMCKMESALFVWISDQNRKGNPINSKVIRSKGKTLYDMLASDEASTSAEPGRPTITHPDFLASKGWFDKFKRRFSLHKLKMSGESGLADHISTAAFPGTSKNIIDEKRYRQEGEVRELVEEHTLGLNDEELLEIVQAESEDEEEESVAEASQPQALTLEKLGQVMRMTAQLKQFFYDIDPSMLRALKVMSDIDRSIIPYKTLFVDMKRKQSQLPITMFFTRKPVATPATTPTASPEPQLVAESDSVANSDSSNVGSDAGSEELESTH